MTDAHEPQTPRPDQRPTNGLGLAGFIVACAGLVTCIPLVTLLGAILSAIGMRREPRGFAIAGLTIGIVGTVLTAILMAAVLLPAVGAARETARRIKTEASAREIALAVERYRAQHDALPTSIDRVYHAGLIDDTGVLNDAWGDPIRYEVRDGAFALISNGPDAEPGTEDDFVLYPAPEEQ